MKSRGFTLIELMVALVAASVLTIFVLMLTRSHLSAFEQNNQILGVQENERAGFNYIEPLLRNACGGIQSGLIWVDTASANFSSQCVRVFNGATTNSGSFAQGGSSAVWTANPDAIEIVYGSAKGYSVAASGSVWTGTAIQIVLDAGSGDINSFSTGNYVLLTNDYITATLVGPVTVDTTNHKLTVTLSAALSSIPSGITLNTSSTVYVILARTIALYVDQSMPNNPVLMLDPDGMAGTTHTDAIPLLDGVEDFQIAVADDAKVCTGCTSCNGLAEGSPAVAPTDEWYGNSTTTNEFPLPTPSTGSPWAGSTCTAGTPHLIAIRASMLVRTLNQYPGAPFTPTQIEDRTTFTTQANAGPRRRALQIQVTPREWNLSE